MHHCHCGFCQKSHGTATGTVVGIDPDRIHWEARGDEIVYRASNSSERISCAHCGSPLSVFGEGMPLFIPTGLLEGDFGNRAEFHIFVAAKAPWIDIEDDLPTFDHFPTGIDAPIQPSRESVDPPTGVRGSCLCGDIRYVVEGPELTARNCHCIRCQRARGAAHASNLIVETAYYRWTAGEDSIRRYKVPEARHFTQSFCGRCGACVPTVDQSRGIAIIPMGGLDDAPATRPQEHIWVNAKAIWHDIHDALPQHPEGPPNGKPKSKTPSPKTP